MQNIKDCIGLFYFPLTTNAYIGIIYKNLCKTYKIADINIKEGDFIENTYGMSRGIWIRLSY